MSKVLVIFGFLMSFAAGITVGWRVIPPADPVPVATVDGDPKGSSPDGGPRHHGGGDRDRDRSPTGWLTEVLELSPSQQEQMKQIWSEAAHLGRRDRDERRQTLRRERDELIAKLMTESGRKDEFDWIYATYDQKVEALDGEWRTSFQSAVEKTKAMLDPEQRTKYEQILSRHAPPPSGGGDPRGGGSDRFSGRRGEKSATSQPDRQDTPTSRNTTQPH